MTQQTQPEFDPSSEETVVKANRMVKAKTTFTKLEHRVVAALIAKLERGQESFETQEVRLRKVMERAGVESTEIFRKAKEICDRLVEKAIGISTYDEEKGRVYTAYTLFRKCKYHENRGVIEAQFEEEMRPFLLHLKNRFTMYSLNFFLQLPSRHSMRIYELLKMREDLGAMRISVEEFRETLGLEDSYEYFTDLKRHVIEKARKQLAEHTDIEFTYNVEREGRRAKRLRFFVQQQGDEGEKPRPVETPQTDVDVDTGQQSGIRFDVKTWFMKELTQEEINGLDDGEVDRLHEKAQEAARRENPSASRSVLAYETLRVMEQEWETR
jgi:plasmid replication initiation protein